MTGTPLGIFGCMMWDLLILLCLEVLWIAFWHSLEHPKPRKLSLWYCFLSSLSSNGWLCKAAVPVASFQEDSEMEWVWLGTCV